MQIKIENEHLDKYIQVYENEYGTTISRTEAYPQLRALLEYLEVFNSIINDNPDSAEPEYYIGDDMAYFRSRGVLSHILVLRINKYYADFMGKYVDRKPQNKFRPIY